MTDLSTLDPPARRSRRQDAVAPFSIKHASPFIGTEVSGVDLKEPQSAATVAALRKLLFERAVLFFRDQHLSPQQQLKATEYFGKPKVYGEARMGSPYPGVGLIDSIHEISGRVDRWHADLTSADEPITIRLLQAQALPELGGDTLWASTEAAYDRLAEPLKRLAEELTAIHAVTPIAIPEWDARRSNFHWTEHPVVRVHPETGRRSLYVSPRFTPEIVGLRPHESAAVLKVFFDHITQPEHQVRFRWEPGSLAIWDNRSCLHYAVNDYGDGRRIMHGTSVEGERPVGVKG